MNIIEYDKVLGIKIINSYTYVYKYYMYIINPDTYVSMYI